MEAERRRSQKQKWTGKKGWWRPGRSIAGVNERVGMELVQERERKRKE